MCGQQEILQFPGRRLPAAGQQYDRVLVTGAQPLINPGHSGFILGQGGTPAGPVNGKIRGRQNLWQAVGVGPGPGDDQRAPGHRARLWVRGHGGRRLVPLPLAAAGINARGLHTLQQCQTVRMLRQQAPGAPVQQSLAG